MTRPTPDSPAPAPPSRVASIDAYRGFVMLLMMGEVLEFNRVSRAIPGSSFSAFLAHHQSHALWAGCSLHDLIQPSFTFLVGVALPFSLARRAGEGQSATRRTLHAFWRALILVLLGVFLRSTHSKQTNWTFEDTLTQIGLGYGFLYILAQFSVRVQVASLLVILFGYWLAFALYPLPGPEFDWAAAGVKPDWSYNFTGFAAHWNQNTNAAWAFDRWFLNLFPRPSPFRNNGGGYSTLSFIPTLGTMILGLLAGRLLRDSRPGLAKVGWLMLAGVLGLAVGSMLHWLGVAPVVKRIWTPGWVVFSGGWCCLLLGAFYLVMDVWQVRGWAFVLKVVGMNSIAAYLIAHLFEASIHQSLTTHLSPRMFELAGKSYQPLLLGVAVLAVEWMMLLWMYRRKLFLRI